MSRPRSKLVYQNQSGRQDSNPRPLPPQGDLQSATKTMFSLDFCRLCENRQKPNEIGSDGKATTYKTRVCERLFRMRLLSQTAERLGISTASARRLADLGKIEAFRPIVASWKSRWMPTSNHLDVRSSALLPKSCTHGLFTRTWPPLLPGQRSYPKVARWRHSGILRAKLSSKVHKNLAALICESGKIVVEDINWTQCGPKYRLPLARVTRH